MHQRLGNCQRNAGQAFGCDILGVIGQRAAIGMMTAQIGKRALICTDARLGGDPQFLAIVADIQANGVAVKVFDRTEADLPINGISGCCAFAATATTPPRRRGG